MEIIILATGTALAYLIIIMKVFGIRKTIRYQVLFDLVATFLVPWLFAGSFAGMATAIISGLFLSLILAFMTVIYKAVNWEPKVITNIKKAW